MKGQLDNVELSEDIALARKQWNSIKIIVKALEERVMYQSSVIRRLENEIAKVSRSEIDALYAENERLTNLLENY